LLCGKINFLVFASPKVLGDALCIAKRKIFT